MVELLDDSDTLAGSYVLGTADTNERALAQRRIAEDPTFAAAVSAWEQRLSPLFVSVHATDPELRSRLLVNPRAGLLLEQLAWFQRRQLQIHAQVVVCPGLNDGPALERTLLDLAGFAGGEWPAVLSAAVVPVGLTRYRPAGDGLQPVDPACARRVIAQVEPLQQRFSAELGSRFAWLSDEWYLMAGLPLPPRASYEDLPQEGNGVGSIRAFLEAMDAATAALPQALDHPRRISWVVGKLVAQALQPAVDRLNAVQGLELLLHGLPSPYWGQDQVVTGLLKTNNFSDGLYTFEVGIAAKLNSRLQLSIDVLDTFKNQPVGVGVKKNDVAVVTSVVAKY